MPSKNFPEFFIKMDPVTVDEIRFDSDLFTGKYNTFYAIPSTIDHGQWLAN